MMPTEPESPVVVKVGGSLLDHPALKSGLRRWLAEQRKLSHLFVPGGGKLADVIRDYHRTHAVSEEDCHWLAIETMSINARLLKALVTDCSEVDHPSQQRLGPTAVLNATRFCLDDERLPGALPHDWRVTSDSIAARAAEVAHARLILLKSADLSDGIKWADAAKLGLVDAMFPEIVQRANLSIEWINFRNFLDKLATA